MEEMMESKDQKRGLGIAAIILGSLSILCCLCMGLGILFAIVGGIFSIICLVKGTGSGKTFGIIGIILNGIGLLLGVYTVISFALMINWSNVNYETLSEFNKLDPNNEQEIINWMQQFFKVDISGYYR